MNSFATGAARQMSFGHLSLLLEARVRRTLTRRLIAKEFIPLGLYGVQASGLLTLVEFNPVCFTAGMSHEEILADYEDLEAEDIVAALAYATRVIQIKRIEMLPV